MKILGRKTKGKPEACAPSGGDGGTSGKTKKKRKGVVTTGIVSKVDGHTVVLYATGRRQAGENLAVVLQKRPADLPPPIQMSDGLEANIPKGLATIVSNCATHARRNFVNVKDFFPEECRHVIEALAKVYHHDDLAKGMTPAERLRYHQEHSGPVMNALKESLEAGLRGKKVEPNSRLGKAYSSMLKRWERLTRFLEVAVAPIDNNLTYAAGGISQIELNRCAVESTAPGPTPSPRDYAQADPRRAGLSGLTHGQVGCVPKRLLREASRFASWRCDSTPRKESTDVSVAQEDDR